MEISEVHNQLAEHLEEVVTWRTDLDEWRTQTDRRLTIVEESLLAMLTEELKSRIRE